MDSRLSGIERRTSGSCLTNSDIAISLNMRGRSPTQRCIPIPKLSCPMSTYDPPGASARLQSESRVPRLAQPGPHHAENVRKAAHDVPDIRMD